MASHPSSALASSDTGPTERVDVPDDDRPAADEDALDGPTVATAAVGIREDTASEAEHDDEVEPTDTDADRSDDSADGPDADGDRAHDDSGTAPDGRTDTETDHAEPDTAHAEHPDTEPGHGEPGTAPVEHAEHADAVNAQTGHADPEPDHDGPGTAPVAPDEDGPLTAGTVPVAPAETTPDADGPGPGPEPDDGAAGTVPVAAVSGAPAEDDTTAIPVQEEPRRFQRLRSSWLLRTAAALAVVVLVLVAVATPSLVHALTRPGSDTAAARLAEWGRDHGLGSLVTWAEARQYDLDQPATGGAPAGGIPHANGAVADHPGGSPAPPALPAPAGIPPLPGEGQWQTVVSTPHGDAVRLTTVRPDAAHTSFLVGVLWMDPTLVKGVLHPGTEDPGGDWSVPTSVDSTEQRTVVSAFSAGFRLQGDSHGGWYLDGREARPLVPGAASLVIRKNGTADVGAWGTEVHMTSDVAAVRQNLIPLVDHGVVNPTCATGGTAEWGSTVGQAAYINRSAFGVTASGAEIYVGGPALSVCTLGEILRSAGAVRGMELDINPAWVSGAYFHPNGQERPDAFQLFPGEEVGAQHYLQTSSRDFVSFDLRSLADATGAGSTPATSQHHGGKHGSKQHP